MRTLKRTAEELRDAMEGVWFRVKGLEFDARAILAGKGDVALIGDVLRRVLALPDLVREAHNLSQDVCTVDSEQTGQLTFALPATERRCA